MTKIVRTPTKATGGITAEEKARLDEHAKLWIARAMRTEPIEPDKIVPAIEGLYTAAGLKRPRVVIVPSPLVMAFAYGAAAAIWHKRNVSETDDATASATQRATDRATASVTASAAASATHRATASVTASVTYSAAARATASAADRATASATASATDSVTARATASATHRATASAAESAEMDAAYACMDLAGDLGIAYAKRWSAAYQGGNMWAAWDCYLTAMRDVIGLRLPEHDAYHWWEQAAIHGGFRVMHPEFCMVCDFPDTLRVDEQGRPHCETGPSHRWRDGWSLYHWHGVRIPAEWIEDRRSLTPQVALSWPNIEQRRAACEILGWDTILSALDAKVIDADGDPQIGTLVEVEIPDSGRERFLRVQCGTGRQFALPVPPDMPTALAANAWTFGFDNPGSWIKPEVRT